MIVVHNAIGSVLTGPSIIVYFPNQNSLPKSAAADLKNAYQQHQSNIWNRQRWSLVNPSPAELPPKGYDSEGSEEESDYDDEEDEDMSHDGSRSRIQSRAGSGRSRSQYYIGQGQGQPYSGAATPRGEEDFEQQRVCYLKITRTVSQLAAADLVDLSMRSFLDPLLIHWPAASQRYPSHGRNHRRKNLQSLSRSESSKRRLFFLGSSCRNLQLGY